jgi:hypothetical protein
VNWLLHQWVNSGDSLGLPRISAGTTGPNGANVREPKIFLFPQLTEGGFRRSYSEIAEMRLWMLNFSSKPKVCGNLGFPQLTFCMQYCSAN